MVKTREMAALMAKYDFWDHALNQMRRRRITMEQVEYIIEHPECTSRGYKARTLHEREVKLPDGRRHRVSVVVDYSEEIPVIVTVLIDDRS